MSDSTLRERRRSGGKRSSSRPPAAGRAVTAGALARARTRRLFLLPLTALLVALTVVPFVYTLVLSFTNMAPTEASLRFVGLSNYAELVGSREFWSAVRVTAVFTVSAVAIEFVVAMAVAVALTRVTRGAPLLRALFLLPLAAAPVASLFNWRLMFNSSFGLINYVLGVLGLPQPDWGADAGMPLLSLIIVDTWQWTPFVLVILVGGMSAIPADVYEAASVDGSGSWSTFWHVTFPLLRPFVLVALLFRGIDALKTFDSIQVLTGGGPGTSTTTLNYFAFREGISFLNFGRASAAAMLLLLVAILLARLLLRWLRPSKEEAR
ncbi:sugar ABC transporter permease [Micromonospora qiuiae]|uniref:Sugar ABC transporter permease n=1 Tax=Micromonospora qiuiae TaxID=502268 RepID=A0ABQ4JL74_9ACTN|nr:sugar ABC transporter permease [Micromonospora qiuiae]GIJ30311.1 sugar ABC transporter permease [Micromonospora qiuiae]